MKKEVKFILIVLGILVLVTLIFTVICCVGEREKKQEINIDKADNMSSTMKAVVVKVYSNSLTVMPVNNQNSLIDVSFAEGNIGFERGQEVLIYFDGTILTSYPGQINNVGKIEIIKQKSDSEIPEKIIKYCCNSRDNVQVNVKELTSTGISLTIIDSNEIPYNYSKTCDISKKEIENRYIKNENNLENSITGNFTSTTWKELEKSANLTSEETEEDIYNLPYMNEDSKYIVVERKFNWETAYGKLQEGEYKFTLGYDGASIFSKISILFKIDANGNITYEIEKY